MKRVELSRDEDGCYVADIDGDMVTFRDFEFDTEDPDNVPFERCAFSMSLSKLRAVVKAADE